MTGPFLSSSKREKFFFFFFFFPGGHSNLKYRRAYQHNPLPPSTRPLTTNKRDPIALTAPDTRTDGDLGIQLDAHAEIQLQRWRGDLQGPGDIVFGERVEEVVGGDGIFHQTEVRGTFEEMLSLSRGILCSNLLAVDALDREALPIAIRLGQQE